jgi:hypothetical protein
LSQDADLFAILAGHVADAETGWSLGTFGAIAEFTRDPGEPVELVSTASRLSAVTARGGLSLAPNPHLRLLASEVPTRTSWSQKVALCLPLGHSGMAGRAVFTELGADAQALRAGDRGGVLFDLGLGLPHIDACIRVDSNYAAGLRAHAGRSLFEPGNPAMGDIFASAPHRVFLARVGRVEVFQPIPPPGGRSPEGPHTHLLPNLLRLGRTHPATEPIPEGWVPVAHFYPPHPVGVSFDEIRHSAFQQLFAAFGNPDAVAAKRALGEAVGKMPAHEFTPPLGRHARAAVRVGLRQLASRRQHDIAAWTALFDAADRQDDGENAERPAH